MEFRSRWCSVVARRVGVLVLLASMFGLLVPTLPRPRKLHQKKATVTGTVKVRGKLLDGGELNFNAVNPNRRVDTRKATINRDGTYTAKAYIGLNTVTVFPPKPKE